MLQKHYGQCSVSKKLRRSSVHWFISFLWGDDAGVRLLLRDDWLVSPGRWRLLTSLKTLRHIENRRDFDKLTTYKKYMLLHCFVKPTLANVMLLVNVRARWLCLHSLGRYICSLFPCGVYVALIPLILFADHFSGSTSVCTHCHVRPFQHAGGAVTVLCHPNLA